ncbi:MAG: DUF2782 domain-containing protein [Wenzhouxiangella sp.]|nr:DUF2782 domain-containing protein [Wenzhouxiangella sp.]
MNKFLLVRALLLVTPLAVAQSEAPPPPPMPDPEPLPPKVLDPDAELEPQVVIRREDDRVIEEYMSGGVVYMIRVIPAVGPPYYLVDTTGDGNFDSRHFHDQIDPVHPARWRIIEW